MFYRSYLRPIRQNLAANATDRTVGCRIGTSRSLPERCQIEIADNVPDMIANICWSGTWFRGTGYWSKQPKIPGQNVESLFLIPTASEYCISSGKRLT